MKNKILLGIITSIILISTIFVSVNSANVNTKGNTLAGDTKHAQNSVKVEGNASAKAKQKKESSQKTEKSASKEKESTSKKETENNKNAQTVKEAKDTQTSEKAKEEKESNAQETKEKYITEDDLIYSNKYLVKEKVVYRIDPKTSVKEFKKNIKVAKGQEIKIYKGKKEVTSGYIGTGMKIKGTNGEEYTTSVIGDLSRRWNSKPNRTNNDNKAFSKNKRMAIRRNKERISRLKPEMEK